MTNPVEQMQARVAALANMEADLRAERKALEQDIALAIAAYPIGAQVKRPNRDEVYTIRQIRPGYTPKDVRYFGDWVLKSGKQGERLVELCGTLTPVNIEVKP